MANLLHIIPDQEKALLECSRVVKDGGRIIVVSFTSEGMGFFHKAMMIYRYLKTYGKPSPYARSLTVAEVEQLLAGAGFYEKSVRLIGNKMKAIFATALRDERAES